MKKYAYLDKAGIMHIVEERATAAKYSANGKVVETDLPANGGYPMGMFRGRIHEIIVYDEETMKIEARGVKIPVIPELAALYEECK